MAPRTGKNILTHQNIKSELQRVQNVSKSRGYKVGRACNLLEVLHILVNDTGASSFCL